MITNRPRRLKGVSYVGFQRYFARYILENPLRAGLAKALGEWPLAGSGVYSWPELMTAWEGV